MVKFLILVGSVVVLFCLVFVLLSYIPSLKRVSVQKGSSQEPQSQLYFKPNPITGICQGENYTATIYLASQSNAIKSAQIELSFDPSIIYNVFLEPTTDNFFGKKEDYIVELQEVREQYGRASLAIKEDVNKREQAGNKSVATLSFQINSNQASSSSRILFLNKSGVYGSELENSLLSEAQPLTIFCNR